MDQFSALEAGIQVDWPQLKATHNSTSASTVGQDLDPVAFALEWEVQMLQMLLRRLKRDKVPGPNLMPPALMKAGGQVLAKKLTLLFTKTPPHGREPFTWKGGALVPLWKGKLAPDLPIAYRSILTSTCTTKLYCN